MFSAQKSVQKCIENFFNNCYYNSSKTQGFDTVCAKKNCIYSIIGEVLKYISITKPTNLFLVLTMTNVEFKTFPILIFLLQIHFNETMYCKSGYLRWW